MALSPSCRKPGASDPHAYGATSVGATAYGDPAYVGLSCDHRRRMSAALREAVPSRCEATAAGAAAADWYAGLGAAMRVTYRDCASSRPALSAIAGSAGTTAAATSAIGSARSHAVLRA